MIKMLILCYVNFTSIKKNASECAMQRTGGRLREGRKGGIRELGAECRGEVEGGGPPSTQVGSLPGDMPLREWGSGNSTASCVGVCG